MIIVTGGAGMIGSAVVWRLNQRGREDIVIVDQLGTTDKWRNLVPLRFLDYMEKDKFQTQLEKSFDSGNVDAIIHLGACSSTTERDASYLAENNFNYSKQLAAYALNAGIRFIYASSAATYGFGNQGFIDDESMLHRLRPLNGYGYSKHIFDLWLLRNGLLGKVAGLKYFNVFGPNEYHKGDMRSVVLKAFAQIVDTGGMTLFRSHHPDYADGEQLRDFLYVKDAASMTLFFLDRPEASGIFNIGSGTARSWNDLAAALFRALEREPDITYVDMPDFIRTRYQNYTCAEVSKLKEAGYIAKTVGLEEAVTDYVRNYLSSDLHLGDGEGVEV
jgi:ADP-L-glycero-D-manno-heptose 6-epimerase